MSWIGPQGHVLQLLPSCLSMLRSWARPGSTGRSRGQDVPERSGASRGVRGRESPCQASSDNTQTPTSVHRSTDGPPRPSVGLAGAAVGKGSCSSCHSTFERHLSHFHVALGKGLAINRRFDVRPLTEKPCAHRASKRGFRSLHPPPSSHFLFPFWQKENWEMTGTGHQAQHFLVVPQSI